MAVLLPLSERGRQASSPRGRVTTYTDRPFGDRPLRCEFTDAKGERVVRWLTPRQMGLDEATIASMERQEAEAEKRRRAA